MKQLGVFEDIKEAINCAYEAQKILMRDFTTMDRDRFIDAIKKKILPVVEEETVNEFNETGYGRLEQKLMKNIGSISDQVGTSALKSNVMASSAGLTVEYDAPYGLVGALTPVTNGLVTIACNSMCMIAAGNTVVFNAHPAAKEAAAMAVNLINEAVVEAGGPENLATMVRIPTKETLDVIMTDPKVQLLIGTGGEGMVNLLMGASKKCIAAGPGNPPVIIDETADVKKAAQTLIEMVPFENNMLCITEKVAFVVESVYDEFIEELKNCKARVLTDEEVEKVIALCIQEKPDGGYSPNKKYVGKNANVILEDAGVTPSDYDLQLAVIEADVENPFVPCEQLMPIFPVVKCKDFAEAMDRAVEAEHGYRHSAAIWSTDMHRITEFGRRIDTTCYAANGPTVAATGVGGTGTGSATIATHTGEGFTDPSTFCRVRRFAMAGGDGYVV